MGAGPLAALVLAAGASRRFAGASKMLADLEGRPVLAWSLGSYASASLAHRLVVVPPEDGGRPSRAALARAAGWSVCVNGEASEGMGSSLAAGMAALLEQDRARGLEAVMIGLGDMPLIRPETIIGLIEAFERSAGTVDALKPSHDAIPGHPVIFARRCFPALAASSGDEGARFVLKSLGVRAGLWPCDDPGVTTDVDTLEDLERVRAAISRSCATPPPA